MNALAALYTKAIPANSNSPADEFLREDTLSKVVNVERDATNHVAGFPNASFGILFTDGSRVFVECEDADPIVWFDCYEKAPTYTRRRFFMNKSSVAGLLSILRSRAVYNDQAATVVMTACEQ